MNQITIRKENLPTTEIYISGKNRWREPTFWQDNYETQVTLSEKEIYENAARAITELEAAKEALAKAQQRVDALRVFVRELHQPLEN